MIRLSVPSTAVRAAAAALALGSTVPASANCNPVTGICTPTQNFPPPSPPKIPHPPHPVQPAQPDAGAWAAAGAGMAVGLAVGALAAEAAEEGRSCHIEERRARDEAGAVFTHRVKVCE